MHPMSKGTQRHPKPGASTLQHQRRAVTILCEGACSDTDTHAAVRRRLRAAGCRESTIRERLTETLRYTRHTFVRATVHVEIRGEIAPQKFEIRTVYFMCSECGTERVYGREELRKESTMERKERERQEREEATKARAGWAVPKDTVLRKKYLPDHLKESA